MEITPPRDPLIQLLARWAWNGIGLLIKLCCCGLALSVAIALLVSAVKLLWFFIDMALRAVGGG